ncbi:MAG: serine/threonine protein kinase [Saprospiraceae bacterium]|nr:serine/threonine protein kinase [Saprospiraceae bacterium]
MTNHRLKTKIDHYILIEWLGSGAMGDVYKAIDPRTGKPVAIKLLHRKDMAARFEAEAIILQQLNHQNIARFIDYHQSDQEAYIIMEYVEGLTLEKLISHQGKLPESYALKLLDKINGAVSYLHEQQIIHRDLKPSNIKIPKESDVKILDFGIAKTRYSGSLTQEGFIVGSGPYLAPEQFKQVISSKIDTWAMGVLFYQMITGYLPFSATDEKDLQKKIENGTYLPAKVFQPSITLRSKAILKSLLTTNASRRWSSKKLSQHLHSAPTGLNFQFWWSALKPVY